MGNLITRPLNTDAAHNVRVNEKQRALDRGTALLPAASPQVGLHPNSHTAWVEPVWQVQNTSPRQEFKVILD